MNVVSIPSNTSPPPQLAPARPAGTALSSQAANTSPETHRPDIETASSEPPQRHDQAQFCIIDCLRRSRLGLDHFRHRLDHGRHRITQNSALFCTVALTMCGASTCMLSVLKSQLDFLHQRNDLLSEMYNQAIYILGLTLLFKSRTAVSHPYLAQTCELKCTTLICGLNSFLSRFVLFVPQFHDSIQHNYFFNAFLSATRAGAILSDQGLLEAFFRHR